jgi:hypothetical protein
MNRNQFAMLLFLHNRPHQPLQPGALSVGAPTCSGSGS